MLLESKDLKEGVYLLKNKVLNLGNCPETYKAGGLCEQILSLKKPVEALSDQQLKALKMICSHKEDLNISNYLRKFDTKEIKDLAVKIIKVSILISQRAGFKSIIGEILTFAVDATKKD